MRFIEGVLVLYQIVWYIPGYTGVLRSMYVYVYTEIRAGVALIIFNSTTRM